MECVCCDNNTHKVLCLNCAKAHTNVYQICVTRDQPNYVEYKGDYGYLAVKCKNHDITMFEIKECRDNYWNDYTTENGQILISKEVMHILQEKLDQLDNESNTRDPFRNRGF